jgi:hypothetical protein
MTFESISEAYVKWKKDLDNAILGEIKQKAIEHGIKTEYVLNEKAIINALEKQIPKKPILKTKSDNSTAKRFENCNIVVCPLCGGRLKLKSKGKYCDKCGQALDWSDTE